MVMAELVLLLEVAGGTLVVLEEWGALVLLLSAGPPVDEVLSADWLEVVVASVVVAVGLTLTVVELVSRFAIGTTDGAMGSSADLTASAA